jgi:hypothetical protein
MSNLANPKARKGTNPERNPANANKGRSTTPAAPLCVLCGDTITPPVDLATGLPAEGMPPEFMGCNPYPLATKGRCCHDCDTWVLAARFGHSTATGLRFVRELREMRHAAVAEYLANKQGGAK